MNKEKPVYKKLVIPQLGEYNIKITKDYTYSKDRVKEEIGVLLNIGGVGKYCVQINVPYEGDTGHLLWIEAAYGCSLSDIEQRGNLLIRLTNVGILLAKRYNNNIKYFILQDSASFNCKLPNGSVTKINLTQHDLAFYQQSYYEKRYGAVLINEEQHKEYLERKRGFISPQKKPKRFIFGPPDLQVELESLYDESNTWKEFFDNINKKYVQAKCTVIAMWLSSAVLMAMENVSYSGLLWKININNIKPEEYILSDYNEENQKKYNKYGLKIYINTNLIRGGRRTRKMFIKKESSWRDMYDMDWKSYFIDLNNDKEYTIL